MKRIALAALTSVALVGGLSGCTNEEIARDAITRYFPSSQVEKAMDVAKCESGYDPKAVSPDGANHVLFQINTVHKPMVRRMGYSWNPDIYDPYINTKVAKRLWNESGWQPWTCA